MIPEFDEEDYDPDDEIPKETVLIISAAIIKFEAARIDSLIAGATKSYLKGAKKAYSKVNKPFDSADVKKEAEKYLKEYKSGILDGYTVIQGKKVYWLRDRTLKERQAIFDIIREGITENKSKELLAQELQEYFELQKTQAELITGNETQYVKSRARDLVFLKYGVERFRWITAAHPCSICEEFDGRVFTWDDLPYQQPVHLHCFLPDTRYESPGGIVSGLRAWFDGNIVELIISNGVKLSVTPNHMLLTPFGFARADQLCKGDDVIYSSNFKRIISDDPYDDNMPSRVEDIFNTFFESHRMISTRVPVSSEDLHGDGVFCKGDIDIIRSDCFLGDGPESSEFKFVSTDFFNSGANLSNSFSTGGMSAQLLKALASASDGGMSRLRLPSKFFSCGLTQIQSNRFFMATQRHSSVNQPLSNGSPIHPKHFSDFFNRLPTCIQRHHVFDVNIQFPISDPTSSVNQHIANCSFPDVEMLRNLTNIHSRIIELQQIKEINIVPYHGYVYDFQTLSSLCIGNGVVCSNCLCDLEPVFN